MTGTGLTGIAGMRVHTHFMLTPIWGGCKGGIDGGGEWWWSGVIPFNKHEYFSLVKGECQSLS